MVVAGLHRAFLLRPHLLGEQIQLVEASAGFLSLGESLAGNGLEVSGRLVVKGNDELIVGSHVVC